MTVAPAPVAELLSDADPEARRRGVQRLGELAGLQAVGLLASALGDADWRVRKEAVAAAATLEPRQAVIDRLAASLGERDNIGLRNAAVEALVVIGADAVAAATQALAELDADGRKLAVEVLGGVPDLAGTRALVRALGDVDINVRAAAAEALGSARLAGPEAQRLAIAALVESLGVDEPLRRLAAMASLARLDAQLPWQSFEALARDPLLRRQAIAVAGRSHDAAAVAALARATGDPSLAIARDALVALVTCLHGLGPLREDLAEIARREIRATQGAEARIRALVVETEQIAIRGAALVALGILRTRSDVPELVRGLSDEDVAERAELGLRWFGHEAVPSLLEEGRRADAPVRAATLSLSALLVDRPDLTTLEALRDALHADAPEVRVAALQAISVAGGGDDLAFLAPHATSNDPRVAATACAALTSLASRHPGAGRKMAETILPDSPVAVVGCLLRGASAVRSPGATARTDDETTASDVRFLRAALDHDDVRVRRAAVDGLAAIGGPTAAQVVARALADEEQDVVLAAVRALGRIGQAEPLAGLLDGVHDPAVIAAALRALGEASPTQAFDAAWGLLRANDPRVAAAAVETMGQLRGPRRNEGLFLALRHADPGVVKGALVELAREISPECRAEVARCLDSPFFEVRRFAAELLAGTDDDATHMLIRARLDRETDPAVREALAQVLARGQVSDGREPQGSP
jgi:HEAT repeat protein